MTATAKYFFTTQQNISYALKSLEDKFNTPLVNRSKSGVTLTLEGRVFLTYAKQTIEEYEAIKARLSSLASENIADQWQDRKSVV